MFGNENRASESLLDSLNVITKPAKRLQHSYRKPTGHLPRDYSTPTGCLQDAHQQNDRIFEFPPPVYLSRPTGCYHLLPVLLNESPP